VKSQETKASPQQQKQQPGTLSELKKQRSSVKQQESPKLLGRDHEKTRNGTLVDNNSAVIFRRSGGEEGHVQLPRGGPTAMGNGSSAQGVRKCCVIV